MDYSYYSDFKPEEVNPSSDKYVSIIKEDHTHSSHYRHAKRRKLNPPGENAWLRPSGKVVNQEDAIIKVQRKFKGWYWHPDGPGAKRVLEKYLAPIDEEPEQSKQDRLERAQIEYWDQLLSNGVPGVLRK